MGLQAKAVAEERFRPEAVARRTLQVYQDVIAAEASANQSVRGQVIRKDIS